MWLIAHRRWPKIPDGSPKCAKCAAGEISEGIHEVEIIDPPPGASDRDKRLFQEGKQDFRWIVLKGTQVGASIHFWKQWSSPGFGIHQVEIIEDDQKLP